MNRQLSDWASVAEVVSAVGVVVTLVILILGISENTNVTRTSVYADLIDGVNEWEREILRDPELNRIWEVYVTEETQPPDELEAARLSHIVMMLFRNYEKAFFFQRGNVIDEPEWSRFERLMCINHGRAEAAGMEYQTILNEGFSRYIEASCKP